MSDETAETSKPPQYRVEPLPDQHGAASRQMILQAAELAAGHGTAIVLGAGRADEIPLGELADRYDRLTLNDLDRDALEAGLAAAGLSEAQAAKIVFDSGDLTGVTEILAAKFEAALSTSADPAAAVAALSQIVHSAVTPPSEPVATYDLVMASCVLSQLHIPATKRAAAMFEIAFPGALAELQGSPLWTQAVFGFARRVEAAFIDRITDMIAPGGRMYLSESVQMCRIEAGAPGEWLTAGSYRMTQTTNLADYLTDRLRVEKLGRWNWVISPPSTPGQTGRLYDVQAIIAGRSVGG